MAHARHRPTPTLRLGILGCANVAKQFARDVAPSPAVALAAVASRRPEAAAEFARTYGIPTSLGSYEALLASDEIDAVYIPLPNTLHAEWAIRAAEAGKHVLCEKPLATSRRDAEAMFAAAERHGVIVLESFPYYFQPLTGAMMELLAGGAIGEVRAVQACFGFSMPGMTAANIRLQPDLGGGALLDAGSYPLSIVRLAMGEAPVRVRADSVWTDSGVDISTVATLHYGDGRRAQIECSMNAANHRRAILIGSKGTIDTDYLNHTAPAGEPSPVGYLPGLLRVRRGSAGPFEEIERPTGSGFRFAAEAFARLVERHDVAAAGVAARASIDNVATLEALGRSARHEGFEDVAAA